MIFRRSHQAFSLILTLIVISLLSIAVVGFISSSALDRATARAASNKAKAELAAQAAVSRAMSDLTQTLTLYPDAATMWEKVTPQGGGFEPEGTMLYYTNNNDPFASTAARYVKPLFSLPSDDIQETVAVALKDKTKAVGDQVWDNNTSIDINRPQDKDDKEGWVGAAPSGRQAYRAGWVNFPDPANPSDKQPKSYTRYAFWIEDESFRLNLNQLGATERGANSPGKSPGEIPYQGLLRSAKQTAFNMPGIAKTTYDARKLWLGTRLPELRSFNEISFSGAAADFRLADKTKFLSTIYSGGLNLSRHGSQRLNLNAIGFEKATQSIDEETKSLKQVIETIRFHAPKFGQRFYRTKDTNGTSEVLEPELYLAKVAANIRDYIDPDSNPTMLAAVDTGNFNAGWKVAPQVEPEHPFSNAGGTNEMWAQGKECAPFAQEGLMRFRGSVASSRFDLRVDYYFEFWNMTDKDVYAKPQSDETLPHLNNAVMRVSNQLPWLQSGSAKRDLIADSPKRINLGPTTPSSSPEFRGDVVVNLSDQVFLNGSSVPGVVFKANACTVITTDPDYAQVPTINTANTYYCAKLNSGYRQYKGPLTMGSQGFVALLREALSASSTEDYETEVLLGNGQGYIESVPFAFSLGGGAPSFSQTGNTPDQMKAGSLWGNNSVTKTPSQTGDPRTVNEQMVFVKYIPGSTKEPDQTRFWNNVNSSSWTIGSANSIYVAPHLAGSVWPDYWKGWESSTSGQNPPASVAPAFIANAKLDSIGQLGDVFDPARTLGTAGTLKDTYGIKVSRGGGRTFRIGQPDDRVDTTTYAAASRQWASLRIADFFDTTSDIQVNGLININGVRRDEGASLRAACEKMTLHRAARSAGFETPTDKEVKTDDATVGIQKFVTAIIDRMTKNDPGKTSGDAAKYMGPFMERGEIGEFPIFNDSKKELTGQPMDVAFDRTREELSRRLMSLVTTRGSIFSVYAVGQSISEALPGADGKRKKTVTATHQVKVTFQLIPVWTANGVTLPIKEETWRPVDDSKGKSQTKARFAKPDHYDVQILQVSAP